MTVVSLKALQIDLAWIEKELQELETMPKSDYGPYFQDRLVAKREEYIKARKALELARTPASK